MEKSARYQYVLERPLQDLRSRDLCREKTPVADMPLMALVVGVMSQVAAEASKLANNEQEKHKLAEMVAMLPPPCPEVEPHQVLRIQLAALKINDLPVKNHGVSVAHLFCTPESRELLGSPEQFALLFRDPMYAPLLNFDTVEFEPICLKGKEAKQRFTVTDLLGEQAHFIAHLLIREDGPEAGCWLTDSILRIKCY